MRTDLHALYRGCFLWALYMNAPQVVAQEVKDTITANTQHLENITVTARRMPMKVTSTTSVQILNKEELKNLGLQNMADAVRRFAGTNVRDYGGIGGLKTVSIRNLGATHTAVSYDGIAVSNCQAGQIDIGRFSLDNVSSLSLAIGQDDNLLQPARLYASAGVLNIETEKPIFADNKHSLTQVQVQGGSFGYITPTLRHWRRLGERTNVSFDGKFMRADGAYPFKLVNGKYVTKEKRYNSDINTWQLEGNVFHTFADESEWNTKVHYYDSKRGLPGAVTLYNPHSDERLWDRNFFVQSKYRKQFNHQWSLQAQAKYNYAWNKYTDLGPEYENGKMNEINQQNEYYLSAAVLYRPWNGWEFSLAQDGVINTLHNRVDESAEPIRYTSLTALNAKYHQGPLKVIGTLVGTYITEEVEFGNVPEDRKHLSPTVSLSYQPWKEKQLYLRAMYKNTFRVPTFTDMYYLRIGNTGLVPERATEYSAGITWSGKPFNFMQYLSFTIDGYYNEVKDKIVAIPTTYVWKMKNHGKVHIGGVDVTLATAIPFNKDIRLNLSGNYTWQKAIDVTDPKAKNYRDQLPYTPEHNGNVSGTLEMPWINIGYTLTAVSERYCLAQNIETNRIKGYSEHTASLWREFSLKNCYFRLQAEVINLTDKSYDIIQYYPMPGRSWRITGTFRF